jgi:hypothetical protein
MFHAMWLGEVTIRHRQVVNMWQTRLLFPIG